MKKISYLELGSIIIIEVVTMLAGINMTILKEGAGMNSWLSAIISYILGIIPVFLIIYISKYREDLPLNKKITTLFGSKIGFVINIFLSLFLLTIGITILYNINNFILSQLLNRTPFIVSGILLMLLVVYCANKGINVISRTSMILLSINLLLFLINIFALVKEVELLNFLPLFKSNNSSILPTSLKIASTKAFPLITILAIPKEKLTVPKNFNKTLIISYIIATILSFSILFVTFGTLGINLIKAFEYPEYIVLRRIKLLGFVERIENIVSLQWIIGSLVYLTFIVYNISKSFPFKKAKSHHILNYIIGATILILTTIIFKNNTIFDTYNIKVFPYITSGISIIYIILIVKIFIDKQKQKNSSTS